MELDDDAIALNLQNRENEDFEECRWDVVKADVRSFLECSWPKADVVISNPPFGTKNNAGVDFEFVRAAHNIASEAVYSLHKTSTRAGLERKAAKAGFDGEVVAEMQFDLPKTYNFHKSKNKCVSVDLWRFDCAKK